MVHYSNAERAVEFLALCISAGSLAVNKMTHTCMVPVYTCMHACALCIQHNTVDLDS